MNPGVGETSWMLYVGVVPCLRAPAAVAPARFSWIHHLFRFQPLNHNKQKCKMFPNNNHENGRLEGLDPFVWFPLNLPLEVSILQKWTKLGNAGYDKWGCALMGVSPKTWEPKQRGVMVFPNDSLSHKAPTKSRRHL